VCSSDLFPALIFALVGLWHALRQHEDYPIKLLSIWLILTPILVYLPFSLQRRFMAGYYIPVALFAVYALFVTQGRARLLLNSNKLFTSIFVASILTNVIILFSAFYGVQTHDQQLYLTADESAAIGWIKDNVAQNDIILASPQIGNFIPAQTGRRVLWGHPFETVNSDTVESGVVQFYSGPLSSVEQNNYLQSNNVDYVFLGPRERQMGTPTIISNLNMVYQNASVAVYQVAP
jgi:hypothetical protein